MHTSLFWQGAAFTAAAVFFVAVSTWWLYFSPTKQSPDTTLAPSPKMASRTALILGIASALMIIGALWDASMHISTGIVPGGDDFLWPPHLLIYSGFLLSWLVALLAVFEIARQGRRSGTRDPRLWLRQNPYVGIVVLASFYALASIPGDAIWHELFGIDLTAWSPPHIMLGITNAAVLVSAIGLLVQIRPGLTAPRRADLALQSLLALMFNFIYIIGVLEWELPTVRSAFVEARPIWLYPLVGGASAFFTLMLAKRLTNTRWAALTTALIFYAIRLSITFGLDVTENIAPYFPLVFFLGALLLDIIPWPRLASPFRRSLAAAALYTAGFLALALPQLAARSDLPAFTAADILFTALLTLAACLAFAYLAAWAAGALLGAQAES